MKLIAALALLAGAFLLMCLGNTVIGAAIGWAVGLIFSETIFGFLSRAGFDVSGLAMWEVGAALGFIGYFFRTRTRREQTK